MTYIPKPIVDDSDVLNHVARDLVVYTDDPAKVLLKRYLKVVTEDGIVHDLTFAQLDGLINILDTARETPPVTPLQYLIQAYGLDDLTELGTQGWAVSEYIVTVMHNAKTVRFEGTLIKEGFVNKEFSFALGGFDFIQQFSLSRTISAQNEQLAEVAGTFDMTYVFSYGPNGITLKTLEIEARPE